MAVPPAKGTRVDQVLFFILGLSFGYLVPVALFLQLPLLQQRLPEGICLASTLNVAVNVPIVIACFYVMYRARPAQYRRPKLPGQERGSSAFRRDCLVVLLLIVNVGAALLAALGWFVTVHRISMVLFVAAALAGTVGSMGPVVVIPWVSRTSAALIPAANTGGAASTLLLGLLDAAEGPGEAHPRFGASAFFGICAGVCMLPLGAYVVINSRRRKGIGIAGPRNKLREHSSSSSSSSSSSAGSSADSSNSSASASRTAPSASVAPPDGDVSAGAEGLEFQVVVLEDVRRQPPSDAPQGAKSPSASRPPPAKRELWQYVLLSFGINFVCWGLQPSLVPIAIHNAVPYGMEDGIPLQICTMASYICVTLGHALTSKLIVYRLVLIAAAYWCLATLFLFASFEVGGSWHSTGGVVGVVVLVATSRFLDGFFISLLQLEVCASHEDGTPAGQERKEHVLRVTGIGGSIGTLAGTLLSYALVTDSCSALNNMNATSSV